MNHDTCTQNYTKEHDFHALIDTIGLTCVYCGQNRVITDDGTVQIMRAGKKQDYYASINNTYEPGPDSTAA